MGGVFDREFTKSLIIRDFDDVLKKPFRYVHLFYNLHYYQKQISKITIPDLQQRVQICGVTPVCILQTSILQTGL